MFSFMLIPLQTALSVGLALSRTGRRRVAHRGCLYKKKSYCKTKKGGEMLMKCVNT